MSCWSVIEIFDSANETLNFGSRAVAAETLFETATLLTISNEEQVTQNPSIHCLYRAGLVYLVTDGVFRVFSENCSSVEMCLSFGQRCDCMALSETGQFLLVGLEDGTLQLLDISSGPNLVYTHSIAKDTTFPIPMYYKSAFYVNDYFLIVTYSGSIYRLKLPLLAVHDSSNNQINGSCNLSQDLVSGDAETKVSRENSYTGPSGDQLQYNLELLQECKENVKTSCMSNMGLVIAAKKFMIAMLDNELDIDITESIDGISKIYDTRQSLLLGLNVKGELVGVLPDCLLCFTLWKERPLKDFILLWDSTEEDNREFHILALTSADQNNQCYIQLMQYPTFEIIYTLPVSPDVCFISPAESFDEVLFIEGFTNANNIVDQLRIKVINESDPNTRFKRLLARGHFDEAESFAKLYDLPLETVWKSRATKYTEKLCCTSIDLDEMTKILDNIKDIKFITQCVNNLSVDSLHSVRKIYEYARTRIRKSIANNPNDKRLWKLQGSIMSILDRLDTFTFMHNDLLSMPQVMQKWEQFSSCDLLQLMENYLQNGQITESIFIFNKIDDKIKNNLTNDDIQHLLNVLPHNIDRMLLVPWLKYVFSFTVKLPNSLNVFVKWLLNNLLILEKDNDHLWPQYALEFAEKILSVFCVQNDDDLSIQQQFTASDGVLKQIGDIIQALRDIQELIEEFRIKVSLETFKQEPKKVICQLLNLIQTDSIERFFNTFLKTFAGRYGLKTDDVVRYYMEEITQTDLEEDWWHEIVRELLPCIVNTTCRLECTVIVLNHADVPWSDTIDIIAQKAMLENHPLAEQIREERENFPFKKLIKKYVKHLYYEMDRIDEFDMRHIVKYILEVGHPDMLDDIGVITTKYPSVKEHCSFIAVDYFIRNARYEEALNYLKTLDDKSKIYSCEGILYQVKEYLKCDRLRYLAPNYLEVLNSALDTLIDSGPNSKHRMYLAQVDTLKRQYALKMNYDCNLPIWKEEKQQLLRTLIVRTVEKVERRDLNWPEACVESERISHLLELPEGSGLCALATHCQSLAGMVSAAEAMLVRTEIKVETICQLGAMLFKNCSNDELDFSEFNSAEETMNSSVNATISNMCSSEGVQLAVRSLELSHSLSLEALSRSDIHNRRIASDLNHWTEAAVYLRSSPADLSPDWNCTPLYRPPCTFPPPLHALGVARDIFTMYTEMVAHYGHRGNIRCLGDNTESDCEDPVNRLKLQIKTLPSRIQQLQTEGHDLTSYYLLHALKMSLQNLRLDPEIIHQLRKEIHEIMIVNVICPLLEKIIKSKKVDEEFAFSLLLCMGSEVKNWLRKAFRMFRLDINHFTTLVDLGLRYMEFMNTEADKQRSLRDLKLRCVWWKKCFHNIVPYIDHFQYSVEKLLLILINSKYVTIKLLEEFCEDSYLELQKYLIVYLNRVLLGWEPLIDVSNVGIKKTINVTPSENDLFKICSEIVSHISDKSSLIEQLIVIRNQISYYAYEVYLCINDLLRIFDPSYEKGNETLLFLKKYVRICKPQQKEVEDWQKKYPNDLDPLSEWRLPYLPELFTADIWKILKSEINLDTYKEWFDVSGVWELDKNDICTYAIKGTLSTGILGNSPTWQLQSCQPVVLESISECVGHMSDLEMATAVLYQSSQMCPGGVDQVLLATEAWATCERWKEQGECPAESVCKVRRRCLGTKTEHCLHTHGLGQQRYLKLVHQPQDLIEALYSDERIVQRSKAIVLHCPDINAAVNEIADIHEIDVFQIRWYIIEQMLQAKSSPIDLNNTFTQSTSLFTEHITPTDDPLLRVCYICSSGGTEEDLTTWCSQLSALGRGASRDETTLSDEGSPSVTVRLRALRCVQALAKDEVEGFEGGFEDYLQKLKIIERLESLGLPIDLEELTNRDKPDFIKKLLQTNGRNPLALSVTISILEHFSINLPVLWEAVLKRCAQLGVIHELRRILPALRDRAQIISSTVYAQAWEKLLEFSYASIDEKQCVEAVNLLQSCPVTSKLNLLKICERCIQIHKEEYAAILLPYLSAEDREKLLQELLRNDLSELSRRIKTLACNGLLTANWALDIITAQIK